MIIENVRTIKHFAINWTLIHKIRNGKQINDSKHRTLKITIKADKEFHFNSFILQTVFLTTYRKNMARIQLFLCFTILFASATLLDVVSAHLKIKAALPQIEDPKTVNDVEPYTVKVVMVFVTDLETECPKTSKFKAFFEKLRAYAKYVCPIKRSNQKEDYDLDMKAKAGSLFQTIASFAIGKVSEGGYFFLTENLQFMNHFIDIIMHMYNRLGRKYKRKKWKPLKPLKR